MYRSTRVTPSAFATRCSASTRGLGTPLPARNSVDALSASPTVTLCRWECVSRDCREGPAAVFGGERLGELAEVALEDLVEPVLRELDPGVGDAALGVVVGADLLCPLARPHLGTARGGHLRLLPLAFRLVQPCAQDAYRLVAVLQLRALVLHRDDDAG